ncbi:MAG: PKD domain-containing protein [Bacteroidia bacterium]|nr:PKD domain-containing protein [Bacteroidia bacterium]
MKNILLSLITILFTTSLSGQNCSASFIFTISPTGNISFTNTSIYPSTVTPVFTWDTGDGMTYSTNTLAQTISTTYTSNGTYHVQLTLTTPFWNQCSASSQDTAITVSNPNCPLSASLSVSSGGLYNPTVNFSNASTNTISTTTYTWYFGDGASSSLPNPIHTYTANGIYDYTLNVANNPTCTSFYRIPTQNTIWGPTHICYYSDTLLYAFGPSPGLVSFSMFPVGNRVVSAGWAFGNGLLVGAVTTVATTFFDGTYTVQTQLNHGPNNCLQNMNAIITITNNPCFANAGFTQTLNSGGQVQFSLTSPSSNSNIAYYWDFGDGVTSTLASPIHTFPSAGNFTTMLISHHSTYTVACSDTSTVNISVSGIPCVANSNFSFQSTSVPHQYYITPSFPYNISSVTWDWGDGSSSNVLYTSHTYSTAGSYDVCMTVTAACGSTSTTCYNQTVAKGSSGGMVYVYVQQPEKITNANSEDSEKMSYLLFPNPCENQINLRFNNDIEISQIQIFSLYGQEVYCQKYYAKTDFYTCDLKSISNGVYYLKLNTRGTSAIRKIIISK